MTGKTHMICGVSAYACTMIMVPVVWDAGLVDNVAALAASSIGSYLPDIDLATSKAGKKAPWISKLTTHRGVTHTLLFPALLFVAAYFTNTWSVLPTFLFGMIVGWIAHIIADLFNSKGVPLFWPLFREKVHIASFKTDNETHQVIFIALWEAVIICLLLIHFGVFSLTAITSMSQM